MNSVLSFLLSLVTVISLSVEGIPYFFVPTLSVDASVTESEVSSRATGFLYGMAQDGVPDGNMVESLDVSSVSQKVIGGLQHPIGDVDDVSPLLETCDYITVYLQDCFDTWYYCHDEIMALRNENKYDCKEFVKERFLPQVTQKVTLLKDKNYADRLVYCPYNEADNAVWFGTPSPDGTWLMFDDEAEFRFYEAWEETYNLIRSIDPDAVIGGPGYCDYDIYEITRFLEYCKEHNCLPDIMIYHELSDTSSLYWEDHVNEYRKKEKELGLTEIPIIVTEYGTMAECGAPADMLRYIIGIENSGVWANMAYWRLANNLCDTAADNNSPNSNWWLFRWYGDMNGSLLKTEVIDIFHGDFANVFKYGFNKFHYDEFTGLSSMNDEKDEITVLCKGNGYDSQVSFKKLNKTNLGNKINVKIERVMFEGISGIVNSPTTVREYTANSFLGKLSIKLENPDPTAVYKITLSPSTEKLSYKNENLPVRYEFEHGTLSGNSYTYDSAYATTGEINGMVGGFENTGDGVTLSFNVSEDGYYDLSLIYGNSNDGRTPDERKNTLAYLTLDSIDEELYFPNTIKSEYTDKMTLVKYLEKGEHTISLCHGEGTFVLDSMILKIHEEEDEITVMKDSDRTTDSVRSFLAVAPLDGFYRLTSNVDSDFTIDASRAHTEGESVVYLRKGLNYIDFESSEDVECRVYFTDETGFTQKVVAEDMTLSSPAVLNEGFIDGISSLGGSASFSVTVPESGEYKMTVGYSNNDEGGVHSYNVDLIERYITVNVNNQKEKLWCRNTYSWDTVKTATVSLSLNEGENLVSFTNDGSTIFNSTPSYAPHIFWVTVNEVCD